MQKIVKYFFTNYIYTIFAKNWYHAYTVYIFRRRARMLIAIWYVEIGALAFWRYQSDGHFVFKFIECNSAFFGNIRTIEKQLFHSELAFVFSCWILWRIQYFFHIQLRDIWIDERWQLSMGRIKCSSKYSDGAYFIVYTIENTCLISNELSIWNWFIEIIIVFHLMPISVHQEFLVIINIDFVT